MAEASPATAAAAPAADAAVAPAALLATAAAAAAAAPAQQRHSAPPKSKSCVCCDIPVALYGRLLPCAHAFCLVCSSSMTICYICNSTIARLERVDADELFVSPLTLQSFTTEAALEQNTKQAYARLMAIPQGVLAGAGRTG